MAGKVPPDAAAGSKPLSGQVGVLSPKTETEITEGNEGNKGRRIFVAGGKVRKVPFRKHCTRLPLR